MPLRYGNGVGIQKAPRLGFTPKPMNNPEPQVNLQSASAICTICVICVRGCYPAATASPPLPRTQPGPDSHPPSQLNFTTGSASIRAW